MLPTLPSRPGVGGAIVILPPEPSDQLVALRARGFPFVVVDPRTTPPRDVASVSAAHFAGARSLTHHLVQLGHRRIGVIAGPHNWLSPGKPAWPVTPPHSPAPEYSPDRALYGAKANQRHNSATARPVMYYRPPRTTYRPRLLQ